MNYLKGLIFFSIFMCFISCQKELNNSDYVSNGTDTTGIGADSTTSADTTVTIDTSAVLNQNTNPYYDVTINGVHYAQNVTETNGYEAGSGMGGDYDVNFGGSISLETSTPTGDKKGFGIDKGIYYGYQDATEETFNGFFLPGTYPYSADAKAGVQVSWGDKDVKTWTKGLGTADQTGSTFKIVSISEAPSLVGHYIKVKSEFNCNLYDGEGNSLTLTKGSAVIIFGML